MGTGDRERAHRPGLDMSVHVRDGAEQKRDMAAKEIVERRAGAVIGDVGELDARHLREQLAREMIDRAHAGRAVLMGLPEFSQA